jgi:serine phosphatase RsbU (regulator of sigma subunit)
VAAWYEPAREVGGDLYDFIALTGGRWAVIVADVTDKGVPAAMVMASCRSVLRGVANAPDGPGPGEVLRRVNELLLLDTPDNMFVTCFYAVIDPDSGLLSYANAGHPLPMLWSGSIVQIEARGMPLGLMPGMTYEEGSRIVAPGENLLLYSDGVTEARNSRGEMFGSERLGLWLRGRDADAHLLGDLMAELTAFVRSAEDLGDDVTLVALRRTRHSRTDPAPDRS